MRSIRSKLTYANVMATLAFFGMLGTGAYAVSTKAPPNSVNSAAIVNGAVKSKDVANNSLTGKDIKESALGGSGGPPSGPAGGDLVGNYPKPQIARGSIDFGQLGTITQVTEHKDVDSSSGDEVIALCPPGTWPIRGGAGIALGSATLSASIPFQNDSTGRTGWQANSGPGIGQLFAVADCLDGWP